jgi:hypothetical protein
LHRHAFLAGHGDGDISCPALTLLGTSITLIFSVCG